MSDIVRQVDELELVDWRRRVGDLYRSAADANAGLSALGAFRAGRDRLFATHPQSPLPPADRAEFTGLRYFEPDPGYRFPCRLEPCDDQDLIEIDTGGADGVVRYRRAGTVSFVVTGTPCRLTVFSLLGYGGGLFLPFADQTSGRETYGGGRYLFDTIKNHLPVPLREGGDDLLELDFNYAYNPSCAYDARWACPLAPAESRLPLSLRAGELVYHA
ncbi:MAG: DUF1684 domain-containing protein [Candidatus Dormibacteria bacterium]